MFAGLVLRDEDCIAADRREALCMFEGCRSLFHGIRVFNCSINMEVLLPGIAMTLCDEFGIRETERGVE